LLRLLKYFLQQLKISYLIHAKYPVAYPVGYFKSAVPHHFLQIKGLQIGENVIFKNWNILVGDYTFVGDFTFVDHCLSIGKFCSISREVNIGMANHPFDHISTNTYFYAAKKGWLNSNSFDARGSGAVEIGHDVLISAKATVLMGVKIGHGAVIGAGAVVTKDIPPYAIAAGVPAKVIRYRFDEDTIRELLASEWWNAPEVAIRKNAHLFSDPRAFILALKQEV